MLFQGSMNLHSSHYIQSSTKIDLFNISKQFTRVFNKNISKTSFYTENQLLKKKLDDLWPAHDIEDAAVEAYYNSSNELTEINKNEEILMNQKDS